MQRALSGAAQAFSTDAAAFRLDGAADVAPPARAADLTVWVEWSGDQATIARRLAEVGADWGFTSKNVCAEASRTGVWRCSFADEGREIDGPARVVSLLRRLERVAPWMKVERSGRLAPVADNLAHLEWDRLGRRMLP